MKKYVILKNQGHNRIYFDTSKEIAFSELKAVSDSNDMQIIDIEEGIDSLPASIQFSSEKELEEDDFTKLGSTSIFYALFEVVENGLLKPIKVPDFRKFPESMVQILKYNGKTNEQFTRLMVNLALSACKTTSSKITLLDPMCGKGTTLYEGFIRGFNVEGVEINPKWFLEIRNYVIRYLKEGRFKHKAQKAKVTDHKGKKIADSTTVIAAPTKEDFKEGNIQDFKVFNGDTKMTNKLVKKKSVDIIVSDLPYGVQHGSKTDNNKLQSRSPINLIKESIVSWNSVLKTKGSIVLSFNEFTMKYEEIQEVLENNNFEVLKDSPYNNYIHRVDQSIKRNLIVAVKK